MTLLEIFLVLAPMWLARKYAAYRVNKVLKSGSVRDIQAAGRVLQGVADRVQGAGQVGLVLEQSAEQIVLDRNITIEWTV